MPSTTSSPASEADSVDPRDALCTNIAYRFTDPTLLELALRHRSWCAEHGSVESNERLEFLGDAVLGLVVTDHLYRTAPGMSEGVLARRRSELVSAAALGEVARRVHLGEALALGKGEESTGGRDKTSILADAMEAVIGAVYMDGGVSSSTAVVLHLLDSRIVDVVHGGLASDYKSQLQELAARKFGQLPRYELTEDGPEHEKRFSARVMLDGETWGRGDGRTKKEAEQSAAGTAVRRLIDVREADRRADARGGSGADDPGSSSKKAATTRGRNNG